MTIENISDTARWVAEYRALETARPDAIFRDPFASRLAGERGREILAKMPRGKSLAWPMIVRTAIFDEVVMEAVGKGTDLVVNLAAGLDARPWRLELPRDLQWVDVDLPGILHYKTDMLREEQPVCRYEAVTADLRDVEGRRALFSRLGAGSKRALLLSEGLLVYLPAEQVASLARDLHAQPTFQEWMIDLASPKLLKRMTRMWGKNVEQGGAPFVFGPQEGTGFFLPHGWREERFLSMWDEARRLDRRMTGAWFWDLVGKILPKKSREEVRRFSGLVLLERV